MKLLETTTDTYRIEIEGKEHVYPRVTSILSVVRDLSAISPERLAHAAERGRAVHRAVWLLEAGGDGSGLDWKSVHPDLVPYLTAYQAFKTGTGCRILQKEKLVVSTRYQYAGRADLLVEGIGKSHDLLDIKTGLPDPSHALQLAAYTEAYREGVNTKRTYGRLILYLRDNGTYRLDRCEGQQDFAVFLACAQVYRWKQAQGETI